MVSKAIFKNQSLLTSQGNCSHLSATHHLVLVQPFENNVLHFSALHHHSQDCQRDIVKTVSTFTYCFISLSHSCGSVQIRPAI